MIEVKLIALLLFPAVAFSSQDSSTVSANPADSSEVREPIDMLPQAEELFDQIISDNEESEAVDRLLWLSEHPYDLNTVTHDELMSIPGITPSEAERVIAYRRLIVRFTNVNQLMILPGDGEEILAKLRPYISVKTTSRTGKTSSPVVRMRSRAVRDLQLREGFVDNSFRGSPPKIYDRITVEGRNELEAGLLFEKDAGERIGDGFTSGYARIGTWGFLSGAVIGDYVIEAGQGLVFWRSTAFGKGSDVITSPRKSPLGPKPYRSTDEFHYLRGVAVSSEVGSAVGDMRIDVFYSIRKLDATIDELGRASGFYEEGLFRTAGEVAKHGALMGRLIGGSLNVVGGDKLTIGVAGYREAFSRELNGDGVFDLRGTTASAIGVNGAVGVGRASFFAEVARSEPAAYAGVGGVIIDLGGRDALTMVYRDYSPRFTSLHSNGFGERADTRNERGLYAGVQLQIVDWLRATAYGDMFKFPWRTFSNPVPTSGRELFAQLDAQVSNRVNLSLRILSKSLEGNEASFDSLGRELRTISERLQWKARLTATYDATRRLRLRSRAEFTDVRYPAFHRFLHGNLFYQDFRYGLKESLSIEGRLVFFDTQTFDARLYEYENDLRGVFANPALFGKGRRWYVLLRYTPSRMISISTKYSETQKDGVASIGSGTSEISGDIDNRISVQIDLNL